MSLVLATDYRVRDFDTWWRAISDVTPLTALTAHHLVVYRGIEDESRVFVTIGIRDRRPLKPLLASPDVITWFDATGVEDIPPIFAGEVIEKIDLLEPSMGFHGSTPVIVAGIVQVADFERFWGLVHAHLDRIRESGVTRYWAYRALDDPQEVMFLQEIATERQAGRWIRHPDAAAEWMGQAGIGAYPPLFVGRLVQALAVPSSVA